MLGWTYMKWIIAALTVSCFIFGIVPTAVVSAIIYAGMVIFSEIYG